MNSMGEEGSYDAYASGPSSGAPWDQDPWQTNGDPWSSYGSPGGGLYSMSFATKTFKPKPPPARNQIELGNRF